MKVNQSLYDIKDLDFFLLFVFFQHFYYCYISDK